MKYGCCLNMIAAGADKTGQEWIVTAKEAGFDYVELPLAEMMALSDEEFEAIIKRLERAGIPCEACNNFFPRSIRLTGPDVNMEEIMDYAVRALSRAEAIGAERLVFGSGPAKNVPDGFDMAEGYRQVVNLLKAVAPEAEKRGITIVIEPLRTAECNLINTYEEGCILAADVNMASVKTLVDFYHLTEMKEPVSDVLKGKGGILAHVHFANPTGRVYPKDTNEAAYEDFINVLKETGYNERISCEAYTRDFAAASRQALALLKNYIG